MNRQNLEQAFKSYVEFEVAMRLAHEEACAAKNEFAEILIDDILQTAARTHWFLKRMKDAAK